MPKVTLLEDEIQSLDFDPVLIKDKRHLSPKEIYTLIQNRNTSSDPTWQNIWVCKEAGDFCVDQIIQSDFNGYVILGKIRHATLKYHDLELKTGIYRSSLYDLVTGDDCVINNVSYIKNYHLADRVMLFNIQEISCTCHSKFGNGILKEGEPEKNRIWIGVGNENDERAVLPFKDMIPADAFLWSRYREDHKLMDRFIELTEFGNDKKLNTFGVIENDAVIKNTTLIKDAWIGSCAYIKGAFKLKNITILSNEDAVSQVGEGVELVNGIMGEGSRAFYQAVAVRFVIGKNCQIKYGARLLNSVLGDNSTVSCCELLNNLIFPFHEQHHNSSFLIASTVMGQSNIASAATIGSNHNSRSPDGEMLAGRGFWPGLCSDFKYDSRFASFVLVSKGSYQNELNITYPFSLLATSNDDKAVHILPAYWFLYNMYAIVRNKYKFAARDKRFNKVQHIETNPFAPDTMQEVISALERIIELTKDFLLLDEKERKAFTKADDKAELTQDFHEKIFSSSSEEERLQLAKDFIHQNAQAKIILIDKLAQKKYGALIFKALQGYKEYRRVLKYFAVQSLIDWAGQNKCQSLSLENLKEIYRLPLFTKWINAGGQIIPEEKINELFDKIKNEEIKCWQQVHDFYDECQKSYIDYKARYAFFVLEYMYSKKIQDFTCEDYDDITNDVAYVSLNMLESSISSREKDYTDFFRSITFRNDQEKEAVLGRIQDSSFLKELKSSTADFEEKLYLIFELLR